MIELAELLSSKAVKQLDLGLSFDEFSLVVRAKFDGLPIELPLESPDLYLLLESKDDQNAFSGYLIRHLCKKIIQETSKGKTTLELWFEH